MCGRYLSLRKRLANPSNRPKDILVDGRTERPLANIETAYELLILIIKVGSKRGMAQFHTSSKYFAVIK